MNGPPVRVVIVDDDTMVRGALSMMLDGADGITVVGEASDGDEVEPLVDLHAPHVVQTAAGRHIARARRAVAAARRGVGIEDADEIGHATGDVLTALRGWPGVGRDLGEAADMFDRAARAPGRGVGRAGTSSVGLRRMARQLIRHRRDATDDDLGAVIVLAVAWAALVREIAAWQREGGRTHQADAADTTAGVVDRWSAPRAGAVRKVPAQRARTGLDRATTAIRPRHGSAAPRLSPSVRA